MTPRFSDNVTHIKQDEENKNCGGNSTTTHQIKTENNHENQNSTHYKAIIFRLYPPDC